MRAFRFLSIFILFGIASGFSLLGGSPAEAQNQDRIVTTLGPFGLTISLVHDDVFMF